MRRTAAFHLVLWSALAGLAAPAPAASRHHRGETPASASSSKARKSRAVEREAQEDPCGGLSRSGRRACEADLAKAAKAGRAREAEVGRGADPCAKLARRRRASCERDVEAAEILASRRTEHPGRKPAPESPAPPLRTAKSASGRREIQPSDLIGGVEPDASARAPGLRGALSADIAVPVAGGGGRPARASGKRPTRLHEVVLEDGQSLSDLAASTGVSVEDLARLNGVSSLDDVPTGMHLKVPGAAASARTARAEPPPESPAPATAPAPEPAPRSLSRPSRAERLASTASPGSGPRPYSSLGPQGSAAAVSSAPAAGRWGRTQADAMAAYAVASARAPRVSDRTDAAHDRFVWPLRGAQVTSAYGDHGEGRRNDGLDLAARPGDAVRAAAAGEVVYAGKEIAATGGNLVLLKHADGWVTAYSHLGRITVAMRQTVDQGQEIAETPDTAGASVHFEVRQPGAGGAKPVDPAAVLPARGGSGDTGRG